MGHMGVSMKAEGLRESLNPAMARQSGVMSGVKVGTPLCNLSHKPKLNKGEKE